MIVEYNKQDVFLNSVDIEDIGNVILEGTNNEDFTYFLIIKTYLGKSHILTFGPILKDLNTPLNGFCVNYSKIDFKENKLIGTINYFLNNKNKLQEVIVIEDINDIGEDYPNILEYISKLGE